MWHSQWVRTASVSVSPLQTSEMGDTHVYFIRSTAPTSRSELQNLHKNSTAGPAQKIHNMNGLTLWYGWHGVEQCIIDKVTDEWCKRLWVWSCKMTTFLVGLFSLTADCTFVHFSVLVWWKLQVSWCYCVEYIKFFTIFDFFLHFTR